MPAGSEASAMTGHPLSTEFVPGVETGIRAMAQSDPQRVALDLGNRQVSFMEVDQLADRLAQRLLDELAGPDEPPADQPRVAVLLEQADALLVANEALRRAAMVIVPIDPTTPPARRRRLMDAVGAKVLLADAPVDAVEGTLILHPLRDGTDPPAGGVERPPGPLDSIMWTSGSTGQPKGVIRPPIKSDLPILGDVGSLRVGFVLAGSAGASLPTLRMVAAAGWTAVCYEVRHESRPLRAWLLEAGLEGICVVPTVLRQIISALPPHERIPGVLFFGTYGESITWEDVAAMRAHLDESALFFNLYGQTEAGFIAIMGVGPDTPVGSGFLPVGQPLPGLELTLIDDDGRPVARGDRGEITVRSTTASLGYWGEDLAGSTVFFPHDDGSMTVRTGDMGRFGADGILEYLGRKDDMVKVAGANRVDLNEVEGALLRLEGVTDAAVATVQTPRGETRLRAFVVPTPGSQRSPGLLRLDLSKSLPRYALPDTIALVRTLPRLSSGKLDRPALARETAPVPVESEAGGTIEERLAAIWREILWLDDVRPGDDFFELGGDSLRAAELAAEIGLRLGIDAPVTLVLERSTVASMAAALEEGDFAAPVVTVRDAGAGLPVFVAHDFHGSIFPARGLITALGVDQPVYGLRAAAWEGRTTEAKSLEELAADYACDVRAKAGDGPVVVFGHDHGSTLAFETARQLSAAGTEVALLVLSTGEPPPGEDAPRPARRLFTRDLPRRATRKVLRHARRARPAPGPALPARDPDSLHDLALQSYVPLWRAYRPQGRFAGPVVVVHSEYADPVSLRAWQRVVDGPLSVLGVDEFTAVVDRSPSRTLEAGSPAPRSH
jgi:acyl-CoA synthetase (AMP-forming)/AMP-acid ligase II/acyl carrier protein